MLLYEGTSPISTVGTPIMTSVSSNIDFRPTLSPKCPNTMAPIGRAKKPAAYVPNAARVPVIGSKAGKKILLKISAAAVPYTKKSYHSIVVPIRLAIPTIAYRRDECAGAALLEPTLSLVDVDMFSSILLMPVCRRYGFTPSDSPFVIRQD